MRKLSHLPRILLLVVLFLLASGVRPLSAAWGESLYDPRGAELFVERTAREVGDVLMVLIDETTKAKRSAKTEADKKNEFDGGISVTGFFDKLLDIPIIEPLQDLAIDPSENFESEASTEASGSFSGRMTVLVVEVFPNGNLLVEGRRGMVLNEETETLTLSGVVRPDDISPANTIRSSQIANAEIFFKGKGVVSKRQKDGLLHKLFNWIF